MNVTEETKPPIFVTIPASHPETAPMTRKIITPVISIPSPLIFCLEQTLLRAESPLNPFQDVLLVGIGMVRALAKIFCKL